MAQNVKKRVLNEIFCKKWIVVQSFGYISSIFYLSLVYILTVLKLFPTPYIFLENNPFKNKPELIAHFLQILDKFFWVFPQIRIFVQNDNFWEK